MADEALNKEDVHREAAVMRLFAHYQRKIAVPLIGADTQLIVAATLTAAHMGITTADWAAEAVIDARAARSASQ